MNLRELFLEEITRTGKGNTAVVGWGRGMGHKGHMMLASSVITHAKELGADPYFVVSRTFGPDDPLKPEEKLAIYKKVFPDQGHIFQTASDELPDLTRVLGNLNKQGYRNAVVVVGADQVKAFQYLNAYNGKPNKAGETPFNFDNLQVISRQMTNDPSRDEEGPRATPMRQVLLDPTKSEEEQFAVWRDAMNPNIPDDEVRDLMAKAKQRMQELKPAPKKTAPKKTAPKKTAPKKPLAVAENVLNWSSLSEDISVNHRLEIIETYFTNGSLTESVDKDKRKYFESLFKLSDSPVTNKKYIVVPLILVNNKIMPFGNVEVLEFLRSTTDGSVFRTDSGEKTYPSKVLRDLSVSNTFTFLTSQSYNKFRTALTLKFNTSLPDIELEETIEKHGNQYRLVSKHGHKNLGTYNTKAGAEKRERQVQYFKHKGESAVPEASYKGNIGIMELIKFFSAAKDNPELVRFVKELIAAGKDKEAWKIVQKHTGAKLVGAEFNESIRESISKEYQRLKKLNG